MKYIRVGEKEFSVLGLGTTKYWSGRNEGLDQCILHAFREHRINVFDTAEMYGEGRCEEALGKVLKELNREDLFLVDKILPDNAAPSSFFRSLENSLKRLNTDYIDLYLLHWREKTELSFLVQAMEEAVSKGMIRHWGVSNFDTGDLEDLLACGGENCFCNQIFCTVYERGAERELVPFMKEHHILPMSYSSLGSDYHPHPDIHKNKAIMEICDTYGVCPENVMLRILTEQGFVALFGTASVAHLDANVREISDADYAKLKEVFDREYPVPSFTYPLVKI